MLPCATYDFWTPKANGRFGSGIVTRPTAGLWPLCRSLHNGREWPINAQLLRDGVGARKRNLFLHATNPVFAVEPFTLAAL
jgi:hypothetical protein